MSMEYAHCRLQSYLPGATDDIWFNRTDMAGHNTLLSKCQLLFEIIVTVKMDVCCGWLFVGKGKHIIYIIYIYAYTKRTECIWQNTAPWKDLSKLRVCKIVLLYFDWSLPNPIIDICLYFEHHISLPFITKLTTNTHILRSSVATSILSLCYCHTFFRLFCIIWTLPVASWDGDRWDSRDKYHVALCRYLLLVSIV